MEFISLAVKLDHNISAIYSNVELCLPGILNVNINMISILVPIHGIFTCRCLLHIIKYDGTEFSVTHFKFE